MLTKNFSNTNISTKIFCCLYSLFITEHDMMKLAERAKSCVSCEIEDCTSRHFEIIKKFVASINGDINNVSQRGNQCTAHKQLCNAKTELRYILYLTFWVILFVIAILGNFTVIISIYKSQTLRKRRTNYLVTSLAICNSFITLTIIPVKIYTTYKNNSFCLKPETCKFYISFDNLFFVSSITHIFALSVDRYIAINYGYWYPMNVSSNRMRLVIVGVWLYSGIWCAFGNIHMGAEIRQFEDSLECVTNNFWYRTLAFTVVFYIPSIIMAILYFKIYRVASNHARKICKRKKRYKDPSESFNSPDIYSTTPLSIRSMENSHEAINSMKIERTRSITSRIRTFSHNTANHILNHGVIFKVTKTVFIVYGFFVISWLPVSIIAIAFQETFHQKWQYLILAEVLPFVNTSFNPFIYAFTNKEYRHAFTGLLSKARERLNFFH